jgi:hypothetical protein
MPEIDQPRIKRINVAVSAEEVASLDLLMSREAISLTAAVRRLISYGDYVYRTMRVDGDEMLVRKPNGSLLEVVLLQ